MQIRDRIKELRRVPANILRPSAPSEENFRVNRFEFALGVVYFHLTVNSTLQANPHFSL